MTDFGLARSLSGATPWAAEVEGTGPFMAPEQVSRAWGNIDVRTDVYGVGAVLFTLLTGRPPWIGQRLPDILADVTGPLPAIARSADQIRRASRIGERTLPEVSFQGARRPLPDCSRSPLGPDTPGRGVVSGLLVATRISTRRASGRLASGFVASRSPAGVCLRLAAKREEPFATERSALGIGVDPPSSFDLQTV